MLPLFSSSLGFKELENMVVWGVLVVLLSSLQAMPEAKLAIDRHISEALKSDLKAQLFCAFASSLFSLEYAMPATIAKGYRVHLVSESPTVPCSCGESTRVLTRPDGLACNFHVTFIQDSVKHYHKECTEVYYILEGKGKMELNDDTIAVEPGMVIYIEPNTKHRLWSLEGVRTIVLGIPAWNPEDEYYDC